MQVTRCEKIHKRSKYRWHWQNAIDNCVCYRSHTYRYYACMHACTCTEHVCLVSSVLLMRSCVYIPTVASGFLAPFLYCTLQSLKWLYHWYGRVSPSPYAIGIHARLLYFNQTSDCSVICANLRRNPVATVYSEYGVKTVLVQQLVNVCRNAYTAIVRGKHRLGTNSRLECIPSHFLGHDEVWWCSNEACGTELHTYPAVNHLNTGRNDWVWDPQRFCLLHYNGIIPSQ